MDHIGHARCVAGSKQHPYLTRRCSIWDRFAVKTAETFWDWAELHFHESQYSPVHARPGVIPFRQHENCLLRYFLV